MASKREFAVHLEEAHGLVDDPNTSPEPVEGAIPAMASESATTTITCPFCKGSVEYGNPYCSACGARFDYRTGKASHSGTGGARWGIYAPVEVAVPVMLGAAVVGAIPNALKSRRERKLTEQERQQEEVEASQRLGVPMPKNRHPAQWTFVHNGVRGVWVCRGHANPTCKKCGNQWRGLATGADKTHPPTKLADLSHIRAALD